MKDFGRFEDREVYIRSRPYFLMGNVFLRKIEKVFIEAKTLTYHSQFLIAMRCANNVPDILQRTLPKLDIEYSWKNSFCQVLNKHHSNRLGRNRSDRPKQRGKKLSLFLLQITLAKHDWNRSESFVSALHASRTSRVLEQSLITGGTSAH